MDELERTSNKKELLDILTDRENSINCVILSKFLIINNYSFYILLFKGEFMENIVFPEFVP